MESLAASSASAPSDGGAAGKTKTLDASELQPGEKLAGRDYRGFVLIGDFSSRDMKGIILVDAILDKCILYRSVLTNSDLRGASLKHADLRRADLRGASLSGGCLHGVRLCRALLDSARMSDVWAGPYAGGPEGGPHEVTLMHDGKMPPTDSAPWDFPAISSVQVHKHETGVQ